MEDSQEICSVEVVDVVPCGRNWIWMATDDVLKVDAGEDESEKHDEHVGVLWSQGGGGGVERGHV